MKRQPFPEIVLAFWPRKNTLHERLGTHAPTGDTGSESFRLSFRVADRDSAPWSLEHTIGDLCIYVYIGDDGVVKFSIEAHQVYSVDVEKAKLLLKTMQMLNRRGGVGILDYYLRPQDDRPVDFEASVRELLRRLKINRAVCYRTAAEPELVSLDAALETAAGPMGAHTSVMATIVDQHHRLQEIAKAGRVVQDERYARMRAARTAKEATTHGSDNV